MSADLERYGSFERLRLDRPEPGILRVVLDSPGKLNAVDRRMHAELCDVWPVIDRDPATRAVLVHGEGGVFSAGGDLEMVRTMTTDADYRNAPLEPGLEYRLRGRRGTVRQLGFATQSSGFEEGGRRLAGHLDASEIDVDAEGRFEIAIGGAPRSRNWLPSTPTTDLLLDRGMMGDGIIDLRAIRAMVEAAGYRGHCEVEILSANDWWRRDPDEVLRTCVARHQTVV